MRIMKRLIGAIANLGNLIITIISMYLQGKNSTVLS